MIFKINKVISIPLSILFIVGFVSVLQITKVTTQFLELETNINLPLKYLIIDSILTTFSTHINSIIAGIWLFIFSKRLRQHSPTWLLLGLCFELYAIPLFVLFVIILQIDSSTKETINFKPLLIWVISVSLFFAAGKVLITPISTRFITPSEFGDLSILTSYSEYYYITLMIITKIVLTISFIDFLRKKNEYHWIWAISSLLLGIFPMLLKTGIMIYEKLEHHTTSPKKT